MNTDDITQPPTVLPTISEYECCDITSPHDRGAYSNGKPDTARVMLNLDIWFAPIPTLEIQIKHTMKPVLKPKRVGLLPLSQRVPPLKKITPLSMLATAPDLSDKPLANLMLHPENVETVLQATRRSGKAAGTDAKG